MKIVGDFLCRHAIACTDPSEADVFGRSGFNRYYYASFLLVRAFLRTLNPGWAKTAHKNIPDIVNGKLVRTIVNALDRSASITGPRTLKSHASRVRFSARTLADLLERAERLRVVADYEPEQLAVVTEGILRLAGVKASEASAWIREVEEHLGHLTRVCSDVGL